MTGMETMDPVALLRDIEECCRSSSDDLPQQLETSSEWAGVAFQLGRNSLVTPLGEVVEILDFPELSTVPRTRPWMLGIANVRGNLLPVVDLNGYLYGTLTPLTDKPRVLVIDYNGVYSGVVVDEVHGLRHFLDEEISEGDSGIDEFLQPYSPHGYCRGDQTWGVFSLFALADTSQFLQAAV
jgi:twitching motility protein PilI